jgi:ribosomal protein S18 acetylase RimI-like enzyme
MESRQYDVTFFFCDLRENHMALAIRHRDDIVAPLPTLPDLHFRRERDAALMAALQGRTESEMAARFTAGHRAYVAVHGDSPAAWGWVATQRAEIGELGLSFSIPRGERYLWNFVTLTAHRGLGIYPRLLDAIVRAESVEAERFWVAYAPENHASGAGIRKAGFLAVAELSFRRDGRPAVTARIDGGGAAAAVVLGLTEVAEGLAPCWRCARASALGNSCSDGGCACDYQKPHSGCAE